MDDSPDYPILLPKPVEAEFTLEVAKPVSTIPVQVLKRCFGKQKPVVPHCQRLLVAARKEVRAPKAKAKASAKGRGRGKGKGGNASGRGKGKPKPEVEKEKSAYAVAKAEIVRKLLLVSKR